MKHFTYLLLLLGIAMTPQASHGADSPKPLVFNLKDAKDAPDYSRLPHFFTSDPDYDKFLNEYFMRHLTVDDHGVYSGWVKLGTVDHMWVIEWDMWMLPWIDRGAMGLKRQFGWTGDCIYSTLANVPVDKYGYTWGGAVTAEPNNGLGGYKPTFGWCWPKYNRNYTTPTPTGWEFNDVIDDQRDKWAVKDIDLKPGYVDHCLEGTITGDHPELTSPAFDTDVYQVPIVELDITYSAPEGKRVDKLIDGMKIYWTTSDSPEFSEDKSVGIDYCDLPPSDYPAAYQPYVTDSKARYVLYFPMYLHPKWGREGRHITGLKVVPAAAGAKGVTVTVNYVRASYDVRMNTTNTTLINGVYKFYMWSGDKDYLKLMLPKLHKAMIFLNEHLQGRKGLLCQDWFVGRDGVGGDKSGHGVIGGYWDLLPAGRYDIESNMQYYYALNALAKLDEVAAKNGWTVPDVSVIGPDNKTILTYKDTPKTLRELAARVKTNCEEKFWVKETGRFCHNIDINGKQHDYGYLHFNVLALAFGIGTPAQRDSILSWLDGRVIPGDTSTGKDIYHWRFAPRTTTKHNATDYYWPWVIDARNEAARGETKWAFTREWGNQLQDGGASPFTSFFELLARARSGRQEQADKAYERTQEIQSWFNDVKAAGGDGTEFYRKYYDGHPERGYQQSPMPGGIGLDHEFLSDSSLGTIFPLYAFLGVDTVADGVLSIAPAIPSQLKKVGVNNVFYRGNHLTIEAGKNYVSLEGSRIPNGEGLKVKVTFRNAAQDAKITINGAPCSTFSIDRHGNYTITTDLKPVRIEIK